MNVLRGQFGKILWNEYPAEYQKYFAPVKTSGPSGFHNPPRPFVFRLEAPSTIGVNLFEAGDPPIDLFRDVIRRVAFEAFGVDNPAETVDKVEIKLDARATGASRLRVKFLTPTELKGCDRPEFAALFARIRDRVSMLRSLYGAGPLDIDFVGMGEQAKAVRMTRCDLQVRDIRRRSGSQRATHPIGGFVGIAEYEGEDLSVFLPYFEAAHWTGVGRQTVWGKGEIRSETL